MHPPACQGARSSARQKTPAACAVGVVMLVYGIYGVLRMFTEKTDLSDPDGELRNIPFPPFSPYLPFGTHPGAQRPASYRKISIGGI